MAAADTAAECLLKEPSSWRYRGEGGATLVLSHSQENIALRLRKCRTRSPTGDDVQQLTRNLEFCEKVFRPLVGPQYVQPCKLVRLPEGFVQEVNRNCRALRPVHRLDMEADENCRTAVIMPDLCLLPCKRRADEVSYTRPGVRAGEPTFCVEIKPKCGFIPSSRWITAEHAARRHVCHYCMLQKLKVKEGKYRKQSKYCPVDFFSGVEVRVMHALECLVADPQNNWRVFCDGCVVYSEEACQEAVNNKDACCYEMVFEKSLSNLFHVESVEVPAAHACGVIGPRGKMFLHIVLQILITDSQENKSRAKSDTAQVCQASEQVATEKQCTYNSACVTFGQGGVLQHLLSIQRLDDLDVEGIFPLYQMVKGHLDGSPALATKLGIDGPFTSQMWMDIVSQHQSKNTTNGQSTAHNTMDASGDDLFYGGNGIKTAVQKICEFTIACTAKDCSIMITFQNSSHNKHLSSIRDISGTSYNYDINLVDLDPKGFDRVMKYHKDVDQAVRAYTP